MSAGPARRTAVGSAGVVRALLILLLALAGGLAVAACGAGDDELSREEYERELGEAQQEIESAFDDARAELRGAAGGSGSLDSAAEKLEGARDELEQAADDLDDVEPPSDAEDAHNRLVEGMRELSDDYGGFQEALESGSVTRVQQFVTDFGDLDSVERISGAIADLEEQGYRVERDG